MTNRFTVEKLVVPVDFSDQSFAALDKALSIADKPEDIHVIHALEMLAAMEPGIVWAQIRDEERREQVLNALRQHLQDDKYIQIQLAVKFGDPGHCIADYAQEVSADLIIIPSHGYSGVKRLLLGSVAERVIRLAHCPVLVLKD